MAQKLIVKKGMKKSFYNVEAPITATKISVYGSSLDEFEGRVIKLDLTKSLKGKSIEVRMKIKNEGGKLTANPTSLILAGSYIRRAMRRGIDYVEDSFAANCRDFLVRIKPFMITRRKVSRSVRNNLRNNAKNYIEGYVKIRTAKELFSDIMTNKLQKGLVTKLKKTYPLAMCEIRIFEIEGEKSKEEIQEKIDEKDSN